MADLAPLYYPFTPATEDLFNGTPRYAVRVSGMLWVEGSWAVGSSALTRLGAEILKWMRHNPCDVIHEPEGGNFVVVTQSSTGTDRKPADRHRFYFKDKRHADAFSKALPTFPISGSVFPEFDREMLKALPHQGSRLPISSVIRFPLGDKFDQKTVEMWFWCLDNLKGRVWRNGPLTIVELEEDAVLFTLTHTKG